jgi:hypothetical protein
LWGRAKGLVKGGVVAKVVDEMWTYLYKNTRAFYKWVFCLYFPRPLRSVGDRDERAFKEYAPEGGLVMIIMFTSP